MIFSRSFIIVFFGFLFLACAPQSHPEKKLTILYFNDVYQIEPVDKGASGGAARVQTFVNGYKNQNPLVLFGGDAFGGSVLSSVFQGKQLVDVFNSLGVNAAVCGNHEFDYGTQVAAQRGKESKFPWLCGNVIDTQTRRPVAGMGEFSIIETQNLKIGIVGIAGDWRTATALVGGKADYKDPIVFAQAQIKNLRAKGVDLVIALTHEFEAEDKILLEKVSGIDLLLGGHDHEPINERVNGHLLWKSGSDWRFVGVLNLSRDNQGLWQIEGKNLAIDDQIKPDAKIEALVADYAKGYRLAQKDVIGKTNVVLDARQPVVRTSETALTDFVVDAVRSKMKTDLALLNGGGFRSDQIYQPGNITRGDISSILPFPNVVVTLKVTGETLKKALENGVGDFENKGGRFPQVSGMSFQFNPGLAVGQRITKILVAGKALDPKAEYSLATSDFLFGGGDGYDFSTAQVVAGPEDAQKISDLILDEIQKKTTGIVTQADGRILVVKN